MTDHKTRPTPSSDVGALIQEYALSIKKHAHDIAGMPFAVIRQHHEEFAAALSRLSAPPAQVEVTDEEREIDRLRLLAFKTNSDADRQAYFDALSRWFQDRHSRALTATDAKPLDDSSSCTKIWSIGNELHNIAIEHQTNEELAARLDKLACRLWEFRPATDAKPVVPAYPSKDELITSLLRQLQEARRCCNLCGASKWCEACEEVASLAPSSVAGWKIVPVEPTPEMVGAFWRQKNTGTQEPGQRGNQTSDYDAYRAMLAASPAPPSPVEGEVERLRAAAERILPYLHYTIGPESPGHHPTMPSAVSVFEEAFGLSRVALASEGKTDA